MKILLPTKSEKKQDATNDNRVFSEGRTHDDAPDKQMTLLQISFVYKEIHEFTKKLGQIRARPRFRFNTARV